MGRKRKSKFDEDFKRNAVKLALEGKKSQAEIAADLGISGYTLSRWKDELLSEGALDNAGLSPDAELRRLRQQLAIVSEERDILKKAIAVFSRLRR
jgi:transposase